MTALRTYLLLASLHGGVLALTLWVAGGGRWVLGVALGILFGVGVLFFRSRPDPVPGSRGMRWAWVLLGVGTLAAGMAELHVASFSRGWPERAAIREVEVREALSSDLDQLLLSGEEAAARLAGLWERGELEASGRALSRAPAGLLARGVDALAVFGPGGELLAWEGSHQGPVPREARLGLSPYLYEESALFGYLYVTRPLPGGTGTAVAASLMRTDLPATLEDASADFVSRFFTRTGARLEVGREDRVEGEVVWGLTWERDILFSVALVPPSEAEERGRLERRWGWIVILLLAGGWGILARTTRENPGARGAAAAVLVGTLLLLPAGRLFGDTRLFSPADLLLPGPLTLTLGDLVILAGALAFLFGYVRPAGAGERLAHRGPGSGSLPVSTPRRDGGHGPTVPEATGLIAHGGRLLGAIVAVAGVLELTRRGASRDLLAGSEPLWIVFAGGTALLVSVILALVLQTGRLPAREDRPGLVVLSVALALALGAAGAAMGRSGPGFPPWLALAWLAPLVLAVRGLGPGGGWRRSLLRRSVVGVLAATLVLPWAWGERVEARIAEAEDRIERLGIRPDPFLEFLLLRAAEEARGLAALGRSPVEILYGAWAASGLSREGVPLWLTWWAPDGFAQEELRIGVTTPRPPFAPDLRMAVLIEEEVRLVRSDLPDAHYVVAAPLARGAVFTAVLPPRRGFVGEAPLGPLFSPALADRDPVSLIPILAGDPLPDEETLAEVGEGRRPVQWRLTEEGWRGETILAFPDQWYRAHYALLLPRPALVLARGALLLLLLSATWLLLWGAGNRLASHHAFPLRAGGAVLASFRARVTLALFAFFLIPTILFGMLAYRTLSGASIRTAEALAARAAEEAAAGFTETAGAVDVLATRIGSDLLVYEGGQLVGGSQRELVELGLYPGWIPPEIHRLLEGGSEILVTTTASLGGWDYVVAWRRMPGGLVLAAPAALQAGATAVRQREVADLLAFTILVGAALSILLALLVGRALTRPIQTLQVASERVGSGNMGVHLPADRNDEFGAVFGAFNRMVDRLARARRALIRSSRRTRAIVEEVATGVVAMDAVGRITLANPRAEQLLGAPLPRGTFVRPRTDPPSDQGAGEASEAFRVREEIGLWVEEFLRDGVAEVTAEFTATGRRLRLRARRIAGSGAPAGAVIALEDVTDELRAERILAWGEMAQQVAHEVKNPLTPIKLGVQHIRRAWQDGRPEFDQILERNVEAILTEIERLAAISTSFSRFAAPGPASAGPLEAVSLPEVVGQVLVLYSAGEGAIRFRADLPPSIPEVQARGPELKEVLVNLLENARAALPGGGEVLIRASEVPGGVLLEVRDTGTGIASEILERIFEPHFSTRTAGTGLGLAIVRRLVESWGGSVAARSREGEGTTMEILLREAAAPHPSPASSPTKGGVAAEGTR